MHGLHGIVKYREGVYFDSDLLMLRRTSTKLNLKFFTKKIQCQNVLVIHTKTFPLLRSLPPRSFLEILFSFTSLDNQRENHRAIFSYRT